MKIAAIALAVVLLAVAGLHFRPPGGSPPAFTTTSTAAASASTSGASPERTAGRARPVVAGTPAAAAVVVDVAGAVVHPGLVTLDSKARVDLAIRHAGGMLANADVTAVNRAAHVVDGEQIIVPRIGDPLHAPVDTTTKRVVHRTRTHPSSRHRTTPAAHAGAGTSPRPRAKKRMPVDGPVDLNRADAAQLSDIPGIGTRLAERIVAFRDENGVFDSLEDLLDISGITERKLELMSDYVIVAP